MARDFDKNEMEIESVTNKMCKKDNFYSLLGICERFFARIFGFEPESLLKDWELFIRS